MKDKTFIRNIKTIITTSPSKISLSNIANVYDETRRRFYANKTHWSTTEVIKFVQNNDISAKQFILFIEIIFTKYFEHRSKHKEPAKKFIKSLKKSKSLERQSQKKNSIKVKSDYIAFIKVMSVLKEEHLSISHVDWIRFLNENFDTGYSKSVFERAYYEEKEEKK